MEVRGGVNRRKLRRLSGASDSAVLCGWGLGWGMFSYWFRYQGRRRELYARERFTVMIKKRWSGKEDSDRGYGSAHRPRPSPEQASQSCVCLSCHSFRGPQMPLCASIRIDR